MLQGHIPPPPEELQDLVFLPPQMSNSPSRPPGNQSGVISPPSSKQLSAERSVMVSFLHHIELD